MLSGKNKFDFQQIYNESLDTISKIRCSPVLTRLPAIMIDDDTTANNGNP